MASFPLVRVIAPHRPTLYAVEEFLTELECAFKEESSFVVLIDARQLEEMPSATARDYMGRWLSARQTEIRRLNVGTAIVFSNKIAELLVRALSWAAPPPNLQHHTTEMESAESWCEALVQEIEQRAGKRLLNAGAGISNPHA